MEPSKLRRGAYLVLGSVVAAGLSWTGVAAGVGEAPSATGVGMLRVTTSPAVPSDITVDDQPTDTWALTWAKFDVGIHLVCFGAVSGYESPSCSQVVVQEGASTTVVGTFTPKGYLRVLTDPPVPSTVSVDGIERNDWGIWSEYA
ncbi:MAG: hypothetical protein KF703_05375, partial [Actinobacteria bacterium]|nr:hypothetical protein [Actinomycetota bacterium]